MDKAKPYSDTVLVNGDFVKHGIALPANKAADWESAWTQQKAIIASDMEMVRSGFRNILPVIGNNDVAVHDQMPCTDEMATIYLGELFDLWFPASNQPDGFQSDAAKASFMQGGYYRHDFPDESITLLALNSMYFMSENNCQLERGDTQLDWLEAQFT